MKDSSRSVSYGAVSAALGVLLLYLAAVVPTGRLALIVAASACVGFLRLRCGRRWAWASFGVCAALSALLLPSKAPAAAYGLFLGYYPIIKLDIERLSAVWLRWGCKLLCFNAAAVALFFLLRALGFGDLSTLPIPPAALLLVGNGCFVVYDLVLGQGFLYCLRHFSGRI